MMTIARKVYHSASFYPITAFYLASVVVLVMVSARNINVGAAIIAEAFVAVFALLSATLKELRKVHHLVDGQRSELLARIDQLGALLEASGVLVPVGTPKEQEARVDVALGRHRHD